MATITKRDLVIELSNKCGLTQNQVINILDELLEGMVGHLAKGDVVALRKFGTFDVRVAQPRVGRNPSDPREEYPIPARAQVRFRVGRELKDRVAQLLPKLQMDPGKIE